MYVKTAYLSAAQDFFLQCEEWVILPVLGLSIACFKCRNCSPDPTSWRKAPNCRVCSIEMTYKNGDVSVIDRKCMKQCQPLETVVVGEGTRTECCYTDLCNSATSLALRILVPTLVALLVHLHL
ncbi:hypothetical protein TSMEX_003497 [Taenia solium]|eukprot:TsM_000350700 transcript=TsM_000350700 gene=TsM_000350700